MIILKGRPISTNSIYKNHGHIMYMSKEGKLRKEQYRWEATSQWKGKMLKGDVEVIIGLYFDSNRKHDWDNYHKLSMDALTGIVWEDDNQVQTARVDKYIDKDNPRIEIEIYPLDT